MVFFCFSMLNARDMARYLALFLVGILYIAASPNTSLDWYSSNTCSSIGSGIPADGWVEVDSTSRLTSTELSPELLKIRQGKKIPVYK